MGEVVLEWCREGLSMGSVACEDYEDYVGVVGSDIPEC